MTIHKLNPEPTVEGGQSFSLAVSIQHEEWSIAKAILKTRAVQSLGEAVARYPIHRLVRCSVRRNLEDVFDDLALSMGLAPQRLDTGSLLLHGPGVFAHALGTRKSGYCSCTAEIWADSKSRAEETRAAILRIVGEQLIRDQMFVIDWHFSSGGSGLSNASFEEMAHEDLHGTGGSPRWRQPFPLE